MSIAAVLIERLLDEDNSKSLRHSARLRRQLRRVLGDLGWMPQRDGTYTQEVELRDGGTALVTLQADSKLISATGAGELEFETRRGSRSKQVELDLPSFEREAGEDLEDFAIRASDEILAASRSAQIDLDPEDGAASDYDLHTKDHLLDRF